MNVAIENKKILVAGVAVLALAAAFLVLRPMLMGSDESVTAIPAPTSSLPTAPAAKTPKAPTAKPRVVLVPGLPAPVEKGLLAKDVVVVALSVTSSPGASAVVGQARKGAGTVDAGFVKVDLSKEKLARSMLGFAGTDSNATLLVVRRPGTIVNRFTGYVDSAVVAQALVDAGAKRLAVAKPKGKAATGKAATAAKKKAGAKGVTAKKGTATAAVGKPKNA